jgi:uncharacterized protein YbaR (Trm112 family)
LSVVLERYVEPEENARAGMPGGTWHSREITDHVWRATHPVGDRQLFVEVCCPECRAHLTLSRENHTIAADGAIHPSLVCPHAPCTWHVFARLADWPPP